MFLPTVSRWWAGVKENCLDCISETARAWNYILSTDIYRLGGVTLQCHGFTFI